MKILLVGLVTVVLLSGCGLLKPLTSEEIAENPPERNDATLLAGFCRYDNGAVIAANPKRGATDCSTRPF
jgi:hypothetical protein